MINEHTWHANNDRQTHFTWNINADGIEIDHGNQNPSYVIPWQVFQAVLRQAKALAQRNNSVVTAGICVDDPATGSVGEWVMIQNLQISNGVLTPKHLSFLGPIYGRMGFLVRQLNGNSIQWDFS